jgi:LPXTG-motif cell wall-anchored protein
MHKGDPFVRRTLAVLAVTGMTVVGLSVAPTAAWAVTTTVSGVVTDQSLTPIAGVKVRFLAENSEYDYYTDATGHYSGPISPEEYVVRFEAPGYAAEYFDDSPTLASATTMSLTAGSSSVANASLGAESVLSGTITSYTGQPVQAGVQLFSENDGWESIGYVQSSAVDGGYDFGGLSAGRYKVHVYSPDDDDLVNEWYSDRLTEVEATIVAVPAAGAATADVQLAQGAAIHGSVTNTIGSPIDMQLFASNTIQPDAVRGWTNGAGYSFTGLPPAAYTISTYEHYLGGFFAPVTVGPVQAAVGAPAHADLVLTPALPDETEFTTEVAPLSGPLTVEQGGTYTWTVPSDEDSDVYAILYSDPVFLGVAPAAVGGVATVTLTIPAETTPGAHRLTLSSYSTTKEFLDISRDYFDLTVVAASVPVVDPGSDPANGEAPQTSTTATTAAAQHTAELARTGSSSTAGLVGLSALLLLAGLLVRARRREARP